MSQDFTNNEFNGLGVSKGIAHGEVFVKLISDVDVPLYEIKDSEVDSEINRFQASIMKTKQDIYALKDELSKTIGQAEATIFDAHILVLEDTAVIQEVLSLLKSEKLNAEYCYWKVVSKFIEAFEQIDDDFIRERVNDLMDVSRRVIDNLLGNSKSKMAIYSDPLVLVSDDFVPSDFALVDKNKILAIVSGKGSQTSHTAILARSLGIPCIVGIDGIADELRNGDFVLVDGYNGKLYLNPSEDMLSSYVEIESVHKNIQKVFDASLPYPAETTDGKKFSVELNINSASDIKERSMSYCDGVGLFRTENFFLDQGKFPEEEVQYQAYLEAVKASEGKAVVIRTLDIGGDKNFKQLKQSNNEENPFMGYRAIRFCLDYKEIFITQLKAILRASAMGQVKILLPMISSIREVEQAKQVIELAKETLRNEGKAYDEAIKIGVMIEVPSAAMTADIIATTCDFISIGTNDLIQYLLAVDRVNEKVAHLYEPTHPAVIRTIDNVVQAVLKQGKPVAVCGELAADPSFAPLFLGMGITEFSMSLNSVSEIKFLLRKLSSEDAKKLRDEVLAMTRSRHIISKLRSYHYELMQKYSKI